MFRQRPRGVTTTQADPKPDRLSAYAAAAAAAGVSVLALTQPSPAEIVYTPANIKIVQNGGEVGLDLNNDGIKDFLFSNFSSRFALGDFDKALTVVPARKPNRVGAIVCEKAYNGICAAAVPDGETVGRNSPFEPGNSSLVMARSGGSSGSTYNFGPWIGKQIAFLGVKFSITGENHFGWVRFKVDGFSTVSITGYAYESVAGMPIVTGQTSGGDEASKLESMQGTLGQLAQGARWTPER